MMHHENIKITKMIKIILMSESQTSRHDILTDKKVSLKARSARRCLRRLSETEESNSLLTTR